MKGGPAESGSTDWKGTQGKGRDERRRGGKDGGGPKGETERRKETIRRGSVEELAYDSGLLPSPLSVALSQIGGDDADRREN